MLHVLWLLMGLVLLTLGGEALVRGALSAARRMGVSPLLAGLLIVGFGTSAPELVVSLQAVMQGQTDITMGNVIGSNIANILLILGVSALLMPLVTQMSCLRRDGVTLIVATLLFMLLASINGLNRIEGIVFLVLLGGYLFWAYRTEKEIEQEQDPALTAEIITAPMSLPVTLLAIVGGLLMLVGGADRFLLGAIGLGRVMGVPEAIIGLSLVAVGTSLPELAVSIVAAVRRQTDVAIGNVIGSCIFNLLFILGVSSVVMPLPLEGRLLAIDQFVLLATTLLLLAFLFFGLRVSRIKGAILLACYVIYMGVMFGFQ